VPDLATIYSLFSQSNTLLRLSIMRILAKAAVQVKKAIQGGAFTFQTLIQGK
jgi:hypothetical protein